ncbi:MAG: hypothetical protein ABIC95_03995 [archaeon]
MGLTSRIWQWWHLATGKDYQVTERNRAIAHRLISEMGTDAIKQDRRSQKTLKERINTSISDTEAAIQLYQLHDDGNQLEQDISHIKEQIKVATKDTGILRKGMMIPEARSEQYADRLVETILPTMVAKDVGRIRSGERQDNRSTYDSFVGQLTYKQQDRLDRAERMAMNNLLRPDQKRLEEILNDSDISSSGIRHHVKSMASQYVDDIAVQTNLHPNDKGDTDAYISLFRNNNPHRGELRALLRWYDTIKWSSGKGNKKKTQSIADYVSELTSTRSPEKSRGSLGITMYLDAIHQYVVEGRIPPRIARRRRAYDALTTIYSGISGPTVGNGGSGFVDRVRKSAPWTYLADALGKKRQGTEFYRGTDQSMLNRGRILDSVRLRCS